MTHFQIVTSSGVALGPMELGRPDWPVGSIIHRGGDADLRVCDLIPSDDPEQFDVLVVDLVIHPG